MILTTTFWVVVGGGTFLKVAPSGVLLPYPHLIIYPASWIVIFIFRIRLNFTYFESSWSLKNSYRELTNQDMNMEMVLHHFRTILGDVPTDF